MRFDVSIDLSGLIDAGKVITKVVFPTVHAAVGDMAKMIKADWQETVNRAGGHGGLYAGERDAYAASIEWDYRSGSDFSAVVWSDYKFAAEIETGRPAYDMKQMLNTSLKTRVSAKGKRYLIIPFRHNVNSMPADVYAAAKGLRPSSITGRGTRGNALGVHSIKTRELMTVTKLQYSWGDRLPAGLRPTTKAHHKSDIYAGMVRFNTSTPKAKSSSYMTFRVMSEDSTGWIRPPRPGLGLVKMVADRAAGEFDKVMGQAVLAIF